MAGQWILTFPALFHLMSAFAAISPPSWLEYPLFKSGESVVTPLTILMIAFWLFLILGLNVLVRRFAVKKVLAHTRFDPGLQFAITRIFGYVFVTLGFYVALVINGVNLSSLAVIAGALGVGIGFGLQNIVSNFVSGLILLAERPVALGDRIEVAGVAGQVMRISLRSTTVVTNDNISIIVPNNDLITHPITNWSHGDPKVRIRVPIGVAYGTDVDRLRTLLLSVAAENASILTSPPPAVYFSGFGESSLDFELGVWTKDLAHSPRRFRSEINFAIERKFREHGIEIPFPQRVVHLHPASTSDGAAPPGNSPAT